MPIYKIKGWSQFQHYKDRNPPWIRLHRSLLDNYEFHCLQDASKALAPCLWLLASENKDPSSGVIDASNEKIAFRLHIPIDKLNKCLNELINKGFIECDNTASKALADSYQIATPETDSTETDINKKQARKKSKVTLEELSTDHIRDWLTKKRLNGKYLNHDEDFILDFFKSACEAKGYKYDNYIAALRNAFEWDSCQPKQKGSDPASTAHKAAQSIIARRTAAAGISGSPKPTNETSRADLRMPKNIC